MHTFGGTFQTTPKPCLEIQVLAPVSSSFLWYEGLRSNCSWFCFPTEISCDPGRQAVWLVWKSREAQSKVKRSPRHDNSVQICMVEELQAVMNVCNKWKIPKQRYWAGIKFENDKEKAACAKNLPTYFSSSVVVLLTVPSISRGSATPPLDFREVGKSMTASLHWGKRKNESAR